MNLEVLTQAQEKNEELLILLKRLKLETNFNSRSNDLTTFGIENCNILAIGLEGMFWINEKYETKEFSKVE